MEKFNLRFVAGGIRAARIDRRGGHTYSGWKREKNVFIYVVQGEISIEAENETYILPAGEAAFVPLGATGATRYLAKENVVIGFFFDLISGKLPDTPFQMESAPAIAAFMHDLSDSLAANPNPDTMQLYATFYQYIYLNNLHAKVQPRFQKVDKLMQDIHSNYQKNTSLDAYAKQYYMSQSSMRSLFKAYTGKSIITYRNDIRLKKAEELILMGMKVSDAALEVGFTSLSFYYRALKRKKEEKKQRSQ